MFLKVVRRIPVERLVFLDESGLNLAMARSHAWVQKGSEYIERTPMNWGPNLTLLGAIDTWREIIVANPTLFTTLPQLDQFVAEITRAARA